MYKPVDPYSRMQSTYNYNMRGGAYPPRYVCVLYIGENLSDLSQNNKSVHYGAHGNLVIFGLLDVEVGLHWVGIFGMHLGALLSSVIGKGLSTFPTVCPQAVWLKITLVTALCN